MTLKNNRAPLLCIIKLYASFHHHTWIQNGVTVRKRLSWVVTSVTLTFDLWPRPFAWTSLLSLVITPENFMMIRWWEHSQKGVTDGRTDWTINRAAWSQLKNGVYIEMRKCTFSEWSVAKLQNIMMYKSMLIYLSRVTSYHDMLGWGNLTLDPEPGKISNQSLLVQELFIPQLWEHEKINLLANRIFSCYMIVWFSKASAWLPWKYPVKVPPWPFQVMVWCQQATRHYLNQCWPGSTIVLAKISPFIFTSDAPCWNTGVWKWRE